MSDRPKKRFQRGRADLNKYLLRLQHPDAGKRAAAALALGKLQHPVATMALVAAVAEDPHQEVRAIATAALAKLKDPRSSTVLIRALRDDSPEVRWAAAVALGRLGSESAVEPLVEAPPR